MTHPLQARYRNAGGRLASVLVAVLALSACSAPAVPTFDLAAPREGGRGAFRIPGQIVVTEPAALQPFEAERILVKDGAGSVSYIGGGQWTDRLPRLIQTRLIETFENVTRSKSVGRPGEGVTADYQLNSEIRAFQLDAGRGEVVVELSERLLTATTGRIVRARIFTSRIPVSSANAGEIAPALNRALSTVLVDITRWVGTGR